MRKIILLASTILLLSPVAALAYGKRPIGGTRIMSRGSTVGTFIDRQVWLPGTWTVTTGTASLIFRKPAPDGKHETIVKLKEISRDQCSYGLIRIRSLKAWGGSNLEQSQAKINPLTFGTSRFKGYTWTEPSIWNNDQHWCQGQDLIHAVEVSAPVGDADIATFVKNDLMLQLVVRSGRSVLPWPSASYHVE